MPTYARTDLFLREHLDLRPYLDLRPKERVDFLRSLAVFVRCLDEWESRGCQGAPQFPASLRVKKMSGFNCWELTWADDGRATWKFGTAKRKGASHVDWHRIGDHGIRRSPFG